MSEHNIQVDPMNMAFAKIMDIVTWIGIIGMLAFGLLYLFGLSSFVDMKVAIAHWNLPVGNFWEEVQGMEIHGYGWFLSNLSAMDCLSMLGICILALSPLCATIAVLRRATSEKAYFIFFSILTLEFVFAVIKPLIMAGGGH